ncbi:MAG: hypothetical protein KAH31_02055 [Candidatus Sabulitectum sp.]|nr:hypothetical protein [Candidatus Sabulitectum sp.]
MGITAGGLIILLALSGGLPEVLWLGDQGVSGSAAAAGMGNTVYADGSPLAAVQNPVAAALLPEGFSAGITGALALDIEKRTRRVYDSFGGVVGESEHSFNQNFHPLPGAAALSWKQGNLAVSAGWRASSTFGYAYSRVMNDGDYVKIAEETLDFTGMLNDFGLSVAWAQWNSFSFGAGGSFVTGTRSMDYRIDYVDPTATDFENEVETDISGMIARGSALIDLGRVTFCAGIEQALSWKCEVDTVEIDLTLPMTVRAGLRYQPGNRLMSLFVADFWWSGTSSVEIDDLDAAMRNSWGFGAGVENTLPGNTIGRAGFEYDSSPVAGALDRMKFTTGLGWIIDDLAVDAAISFSPVRWDQYQADGLPSFTSGDSLVVESSRTAFTLGVSRTF